MAQVHEATSKWWRRLCRWQRWAQRRQRRSQRQRRRSRQRCRLLQSRIYVFSAQFVFSWGGQRVLCLSSVHTVHSSHCSVLGSTHLRVLDVCSGVCLVKRNLAALLKFPGRYLSLLCFAQQSLSRLRVALDEATEQRQTPQPKQRHCQRLRQRQK